MNSQEPKVYVNGFFIREKEFANGGSIMNVSIKASDFEAFAKQHAVDGYVKIVIERRREPSDKGITHSARLDTWKPSGQPRQQQAQPLPRTESGGVDFKKMLNRPAPIKKEQPKVKLDSQGAYDEPF